MSGGTTAPKRFCSHCAEAILPGPKHLSAAPLDRNPFRQVHVVLGQESVPLRVPKHFRPECEVGRSGILVVGIDEVSTYCSDDDNYSRTTTQVLVRRKQLNNNITRTQSEHNDQQNNSQHGNNQHRKINHQPRRSQQRCNNSNTTTT